MCGCPGARSLVICEDWQKVLQVGIDAVPSLLDVAKGILRLHKENDSILRDRLITISTLGKINYDLGKKIDHLSIFLLDELQEIRDESLKCLTPMAKYMSNSDPEYIPLQDLGKEIKNLSINIYNIITSLLSHPLKFDVSTYDFHNLKINDIENILAEIKQGREKLQNTKLRAIKSSEVLANRHKLSSQFLNKVIEDKMLIEIDQIDDWIKTVSQKKLSLTNNQQKIIKNKILLREIICSCSIDAKTYNFLVSIDIDYPNDQEIADMTYNECRKIYDSLNLVKEKIVKVLNNLKTDIVYNDRCLEKNF